MRLSYDRMKKYLDDRYNEKEKGRYFNELGQVVATIDKKMITTYYKEDESETNNPGLFAVAIIKNLYVGKEEDKKVIDAMYIRQVTENQNAVKVDNNFAVNMYCDERLKENGKNNIGAIGSVSRSVKNSSVTRKYINEDITTSVTGEEYQKSNAFTYYGTYLINLKTKYATKKISYEEVSSDYRKKRIEILKKAKEEAEKLASKNPSMFVSELPLKYAGKYLDKRTSQTYDGLIHPDISATNREMREKIREQFIPEQDKQTIIYENVKKKVI